jgi:RND family efflux transporter MFP subunit
MSELAEAIAFRVDRSRRRLLYGSTAGLSAGALALVVLAFIHPHRAAAGVAQPPLALTVTSAVPHRVVWPSTLDASGAIAPWQEASIGTQIGGYQLIDVRVNVGDSVRKGEVLARLNPALLEADEAQLEANRNQAEANRQRILSLQASGAVSDQDVLQFVTQAKTAEALLKAKRLQLRYTAVVAPDGGTISSRTATLGAVVPIGQELFRLVRQNRLEWRGELTATQLAQVAAGQQIALTLPDGSAATAQVREVAPVLDEKSRLGIVYADVAAGSRARAGMYATGHLILGQSSVLSIPAESVVIRDGYSYVLKLSAAAGAARVSLQRVIIGRHQGSDVEVLAGIDARDRLVAQGAGFLNEGDFVRVVETTPTESARVPQ